MKILRWIILFPVSIATWYLFFFLGGVAFQLIEMYECPSNKRTSINCYTTSIDATENIWISLFLTLGYTASILISYAIAPSLKKEVAFFVAAIIFIKACFFAYGSDYLFALKIANGMLLGFLIVLRKYLKNA